GVTRLACVLVGERRYEDEPLFRDDLAIDELAPHLLAVRRAEEIVEDATGLEIDLGGDHLEALRSPPLLELLCVGPCFPHAASRRIDDAGDDESFVWMRSARHCLGAVHDWAP